jgi:hypothetical protein
MASDPMELGPRQPKRTLNQLGPVFRRQLATQTTLLCFNTVISLILCQYMYMQYDIVTSTIFDGHLFFRSMHDLIRCVAFEYEITNSNLYNVTHANAKSNHNLK